MKVIREGYFAKVGDLIRNGWCNETRSIAPPYKYGIVIETENRSQKAYTAEQIAEKPVRLVKFITGEDGRVTRRYAVHIEVIG